jgi:hypothetical protein
VVQAPVKPRNTMNRSNWNQNWGEEDMVEIVVILDTRTGIMVMVAVGEGATMVTEATHGIRSTERGLNESKSGRELSKILLGNMKRLDLLRKCSTL